MSDRKASRPWGNNQEVKKMFVSELKQFAVSGAGSGFDIGSLFSAFCHDNRVTGNNVVEKLHPLIENHLRQANIYSDSNASVAACLIARKEGALASFETYIQGNSYHVNPIPSTYRCFGMEAAKVLGDYFFKRIKLDELTWEEAAHYAIATMKEVAKNVDSVGRLEEFGLDIIVMLDNGTVYETENHRENSSNLKFDLEIISSVAAKFTKTHEAER
jgi:hypothetical protein